MFGVDVALCALVGHVVVSSAPDRTRTCDPRLRRPLLYPPELLALSVPKGAVTSTPVKRRNSRYLPVGLSSPGFGVSEQSVEATSGPVGIVRVLVSHLLTD